MAIFRQRFVIETLFPVDEARKKLLAVVKTDLPKCAKCGDMLAAPGALFCSSCGQAVSRHAPPPQPWLQRAFFSRRGFEFEGNIWPQGFRISRIINYRNSCIPIITGRFEPSSAGTRIVIEMKMHPLGWVFLVGGMGLSFLVPVVIVFSGDNGPSSNVLAIVPFAAPCFIWMVCWLAFAAEASVARTAIRRIWESAPI
jgi:hypothetical protein